MSAVSQEQLQAGVVTARMTKAAPSLSRMRSAARAFAGSVARRIVRDNQYCIWETAIEAGRKPSVWADDERFTIIGPERLDAEMNPRLLAFLGGDAAAGDLQGVRDGDRLLVVTINGEYVYSGYIYFNTTAATRRQKRLYRESDESPVIGTCFSKPAKIWAGPAWPMSTASELFAMVRELLPAGTEVNDAAAGFATLGHFIHTARLSRDLQIPFDRLKRLVTGGKSLWNAVREVRPDLDAMSEVRKVMDHASVHRRVLNDVLVYLHGLGCRRLINEVLLQNTPSQKANLVMGMRVCRELHDWNVLGKLIVQKTIADGRSSWRLLVR